MDRIPIWVRIDNRLVHGQVTETWLPYAKARMLVVANDALACDELQQEIIGLAIPRDIGLMFTPVDWALDTYRQLGNNYNSWELFFLFDSCADAQQAYDSGLYFGAINIGNLHYAPGKKQICEHVALDREDRECLRYLERQGVRLDFRCVPNKQVQIKGDWRVVS